MNQFRNPDDCVAVGDLDVRIQGPLAAKEFADGDLADARKAFQGEIGDVLGKKGARNVRGHVFDHLRRTWAMRSSRAVRRPSG